MNAIEKLQNDLSLWYESSSISAFMHWWKTELKSFVPAKYQERLFPQSLQVLLTQEKEAVNVWCQKGKQLTLYADAKNEAGEQEQWWHQVQHIINQAEGQNVVTKYLLANDEALVRKVDLPQGAKDNLDEVLGFELDQYVPFSLEQVQLGYKLDKKNSNDEKIVLDLAVIPKEKIEQILAMCDEKSISLDAIDVNLNDSEQKPQPLGVTLLPKEKRKAKNYFNLKLNLALMVVLIGLLYFVMYTSINNKEEKIARLTEVNTQLQKQAKTAKLLKKELKEAIISSKFLQNKTKNYPHLVKILADITSIFPDDTYITRFTLNHENIQITGQSDNANSLIPKMEKSKNWYVPIFSGGVITDPRTNKEKFTIKAELNKPKEESDDNNA